MVAMSLVANRMTRDWSEAFGEYEWWIRNHHVL